MPALNRTIALAEVEVVVFTVAQNLHFDVAGVLDAFLDINAAVSKSAPRFSDCLERLLLEILRAINLGHSPAAAAGRRLDHDRITDRLGKLRQQFLVRGRLALAAGHDRHAGLDGALPGPRLLCHQADRLRIGPDKDKTRFFTAGRELAVLGEKPISGMNRVRLCQQGSADHRIHVEITLFGRRGTDADKAIRGTDSHRVDIRLGTHRHAFHLHRLAGPDDPQCNLATVSD